MTPTGSPSAPRAADPWELLSGPIAEVVAARLARLSSEFDRSWVESHLDPSDGPDRDLALPLHRPARTLGVPAEELARRIAEGFPDTTGIRSVTALGAYVNFAADPVWLSETTLRMVQAHGSAYGRSDHVLPTACVEHTSANPTGPLHVGRIRNAIIGDTLARILRAAGSPIITQYYVDDVGRQAAMITWIWSKPIEEWPEGIRLTVANGTGTRMEEERADVRYGRPYPAVSAFLKSHPEAAHEVAEINAALEAGDPPKEHRTIAEAILAGMLASLARVGVSFDEFVWESSFLSDGSVARAVERLAKARHAVREENGALAIDASSYGLPNKTDQIIVTRADGTSLYIARDVAYHLSKFARFARVIDVLGQDHRLHARSLEVLLEELGEARRPEFVIYQDLTVPEGGRMSTRKGTAVPLDALLDEAATRAREEVRSRWPDAPAEDLDRIAEAIGAGAIRYNIVKVAPDKAVAFRWEDALSFDGRSGPFLQYSFVRATSLLKKAEGPGPPYPFRGVDFGTEPEVALARQLSRLPGVVAYVARTGHVHSFAVYGHALAEAFNHFYQAVPVLSSGAERTSRLALVDAARTVLGNVLDLLGLSRLERM